MDFTSVTNFRSYSVPFTKSPSNFPNRLLELAHNHLKYIKETDVIELKVTHRRYAWITKSIFLRAIGVPQNPESFTLIKPSDDDLLSFIQDVGYTGALDNGLPDFKKSFISPHWQVIMHLLMKSLSSKTGGTNQISWEWICLAYSFYTGNASVIDIPSLLWNDFVQYAKRKKDKQINSTRFLALALEDTTVINPSQADPLVVQSEPEPRPSFGRIKKMAKKRNHRHSSNHRSKKRSKTDESSQKDSKLGERSVPHNTPPTHSSPTHRDVLKTPAHTHEESKQNPPSSSQKEVSGVEQTPSKASAEGPSATQAQAVPFDSYAVTKPRSTSVDQGSLGSPSKGQSLPLKTGFQPQKSTLSPSSKRLKSANPGKSEAEVRAFQKSKRRRIKHQSEGSFLASVFSDIASKGDDEDEDEETEKHEVEEEEETEEEENEKEDEEESSEDETIFPLNQTVTEPQVPSKFTSPSGKISIEIASDENTPPKKTNKAENQGVTTHALTAPHSSPQHTSEGPVTRTEFQNLYSVVTALESKSDAILKAVQGLASFVPSLSDREKQLDQLISARLKHSMEQSEAGWTKSTKYFLDLIESITSLQNDTIDQFNHLHDNNSRQHRRELKFLLNQVRERDNSNLVLQLSEND
ncbi:hypothetical protein LXL04_007958 [Taraxacum kok-saghyz]